MLNETNSELEERLDSAAIEEMQARSGIQMPAPIYHRDFVDAYELMYNDYINRLIEEQLIDYIRTTITHAGGITGMRRIADFASLYQVRTGSHGPSDLSPVCHAAALHFDLWVPNFGVQEYMGYSEQMLEVFPHSWRFDEGYMHPGDEPGLGISFDEKLAAKYPYDPAYLPVARLEDGTLWNW